MRSRSVRGTLLARLSAIVLAVLAYAPAVARAEALSAEEMARLVRGETVVRTQTLETDTHRFVGGVTYTIVDATVPELEQLLGDVGAYRQLLPMTKEATSLGVDHGDLLVHLRQGTKLVETAYTVRVRADHRSRTVRFWLDRARPHGIEDAWGFFRAEPLPDGSNRLLLTYGVLVDMGDGLARVLFEERVRSAMLSVPHRVQAYLAEARAQSERRLSLAKP